MAIIVAAEAEHRKDSPGLHLLRLLGATVVFSIFGAIPIVGLVLWLGLLPWVGYRRRDVLLLLVPIVNVYVSVKALWRLTALNVDWPQRPDTPGRSIFREWPSPLPEGVVRKGAWRIFSSVDEMDEHSNFAVPLSSAAALQAAEVAMSKEKRVHCEQVGGELRAYTMRHTPAYALAGLVTLLFARRDELAVVTATEADEGSVLEVRGQLDAGAATRLRALRAA